MCSKSFKEATKKCDQKLYNHALKIGAETFLSFSFVSSILTLDEVRSNKKESASMQCKSLILKT